MRPINAGQLRYVDSYETRASAVLVCRPDLRRDVGLDFLAFGAGFRFVRRYDRKLCLVSDAGVGNVQAPAAFCVDSQGMVCDLPDPSVVVLRAVVSECGGRSIGNCLPGAFVAA
jgi:hypothetical protein